jgi:hypothetical protein
MCLCIGFSQILTNTNTASTPENLKEYENFVLENQSYEFVCGFCDKSHGGKKALFFAQKSVTFEPFV